MPALIREWARLFTDNASTRPPVTMTLLWSLAVRLGKYLPLSNTTSSLPDKTGVVAAGGAGAGPGDSGAAAAGAFVNGIAIAGATMASNAMMMRNNDVIPAIPMNRPARLIADSPSHTK
jgi:hypothetical protein